MEKEFNLSKEIYWCSECSNHLEDESIKTKGIKKFIEMTEKDIRNPKLSRIGMIERFIKRVGPKFIQNDKTNCYY